MKSEEYYLSKGFDKRAAKYFSAGRRIVTEVIPKKDFTLELIFDNGEKRVYDVRPLLKKGTVFEHLKKEENFLRVYIDDRNAVSWDIDPEIDGNKIWSNKIDICSDSCYMDSVPFNTK